MNLVRFAQNWNVGIMGLKGFSSFYVLHLSNIPSFHYSLIDVGIGQINTYKFNWL